MRLQHWIVALAVLVAAAGLSVARLLPDRPAEPVASTTLGGLTATTSAARWAAMTGHDMSGSGFQMPAQMMPGAPEGDDLRLGVELTLANEDSAERTFDLPAEFSIVGGRLGDPRPLHADTFGKLPRLGAGSRVKGVLYFDVPAPAAGDPPLVVIWRRGGHERRLAVDLTGAAPEHHTNGT